ncbi:MAG: CoA transferase, partial [Pseudorhodoplanes sp.]
ETDAKVGAVFARCDVASLMEKLEKADIAFARVSDCALLSAHPHLRRIEVATPSGPVSMPAPAPLFDDKRHYGAVPKLGEHMEAVRKEFMGRGR